MQYPLMSRKLRNTRATDGQLRGCGADGSSISSPDSVRTSYCLNISIQSDTIPTFLEHELQKGVEKRAGQKRIWKLSEIV